MAERVTLVINGRRVSASAGQTLLDAGLAAGQAIPHDCATGQCDTCRVRIHAGAVDDAGTRIGETVQACRARLTTDAVIEFDEVPEAVRRAGTVDRVVDLTAEIVEVTVALRKRLTYLPGQYVRVSFAGLPARDYSPTLRADGSGELNELIFQIRRQPDGAVSPLLGGRIGPGTAVKVEGPFGTAFHRLGRGRLVIVSSGVGWAPAWAVARASRMREPERDLLVVAGARHPQNLYMRPALDWLRARGGDDGPDLQWRQPASGCPARAAHAPHADAHARRHRPRGGRPRDGRGCPVPRRGDRGDLLRRSLLRGRARRRRETAVRHQLPPALPPARRGSSDR
ncbi:MAG: 2Fe-2S iron-sulfur cluster binding domain-containing protein [Methylobacterium radiotolerans]